MTERGGPKMPASTPGSTSESPPTTLLLVEDEPRVMHDNLKLVPPEIRCEVAGSVAAALAIVESGRSLDGLMLDVRLPDGSGMTLVRPWMVKFGLAPVVVLTWHHDDAALQRVAYLQRCRFLPKPLTRDAYLVFETDVQAFRWGVPLPWTPQFMAYKTRHCLTTRQAQICASYIRRDTRDEVAKKYGITVETVTSLMKQLCIKLRVNNLDIAIKRMLDGE